jgi:hypothetical protein
VIKTGSHTKSSRLESGRLGGAGAREGRYKGRNSTRYPDYNKKERKEPIEHLIDPSSFRLAQGRGTGRDRAESNVAPSPPPPLSVERTSSYASRSAHCSSDSPISLRPRGRNQVLDSVSFTTTTLPEEGWMMTMLAPRRKSCAQKQLSGIGPDESSEYTLGKLVVILRLEDGDIFGFFFGWCGSEKE